LFVSGLLNNADYKPIALTGNVTVHDEFGKRQLWYILRYLYGEKARPRTEDRGYPNVEMCRMAFRIKASLFIFSTHIPIQYPLSYYKTNTKSYGDLPLVKNVDVFPC
jgi:hypothetical protein